MAESFNNWSELMEANRARGKEVMIDSSGKRHKVKYRAQSSSKFLIKIINDANVIKSNKVTDSGISALKNFLNSESAFTSVVGQLTPIFFQKNFIVYQIGRNSTGPRSVQKIQFSVYERKDQEGTILYPNIPATLEFIDIDTFGTMSEMLPAVTKDIADAAARTELEDPVDDVDTEDGKGPIAKGNSETVSERGRKFLYTMKTNSKLYLMEFAENGGILATTRDGSDPNGIVSYGQNGIIVWSTTLDDNQTNGSKIAAAQNYKLFQDSEIVHEADKLFFTKMFTDETYRNQIIDEYESEYKSDELTAENLKGMLFYKDGKSIFGGGDANTTNNGTTGKSKESPEDLDQAAGDITDSSRRSFQEYFKYIKDKATEKAKQLEAPAATK